MPDAVEVAIESALVNHLGALTFSPAIPVSLPDVGTVPKRFFTKPDADPGAHYLRATFLPADSFALGISYSGSNQHYGLLVVDCFGVLGDGEVAVGRIAATVIAWFKRGTRLPVSAPILKIGYGGQIPLRRSLRMDDPWCFIPVHIPYIAFAPNPA